MQVDNDFKYALHARCRQLVADRIQALRQNLGDLSESVANETKSTAGDKYETARAMLHIEQDGIRRQLADAGTQQVVLDAIDPAAHTSRVALGSAVRAEGAWYYLSVALGKVQLDGRQVIALSLQSPLGTQLRGKEAGDSVVLNGRRFAIEEVL